MEVMTLRDLIAITAIIITLIGGYWGLAKFIGRLFSHHLDSKFAGLHADLERMEKSEQTNRDQINNVERDILRLRAELPNQYVRREDYVRGQTVIESKLDALALRLEKVQLRELGSKS